MHTLVQDIRYTLRGLRKAPGFALTAILTLALGIGATTAIFTLVHAVLLRSLPASNPAELWRVGSHNDCCFNSGYTQYLDYNENNPPDFSLFSYPFYEYLRDHTPALRNLAAFEAGEDTFSVRRQGSDAAPESAPTRFLSGNALPMLGIPAYLGRAITPTDDRRGAPPVAMISYRDWQQNYGGDASVVGAVFLINGQAVTIVGVTPPGFYGAALSDRPPDYYLPIAAEPLVKGAGSVIELPGTSWLDLIGRLGPGANPRTANAQVNVALQQWLRSHYADMTEDERQHLPIQRTKLTPGGSGVTQMQNDYASGLHLLMAVSAFVLLIACANIANLTLVRGMARRQGSSVRVALGASRARMVWQSLIESLVLSLLGGVAGVVTAYGGTRLILHYAFGQARGLPISAAPSWPVLLFAFGVSVLTGLLFGIAPALRASHANPIEALRGASRSTQSGAALPQKALVVLQAALSLLLLCAAGLLTGSLRHLQTQSYGFTPDGRVNVHIDADRSFTRPEQYAAFFRELTRKFKAIPGVTAVTYALYSPMEDDNWSDETYIEGRPASPKPDENEASFNRVGPDYFNIVGTRILRGRGITDDDVAKARPVAVVSQILVKKFFGNKDPLGQHLGLDEESHAGDYEIVGVSEDTRYTTLQFRDPVRPMWFTPLSHWVAGYGRPDHQVTEGRSHFAQSFVLRTGLPISVLEPQVKQALREVDPNIAVDTIRTMHQQVLSNFTQQALVARLAGLFGVLALLLASIGLYGVTAYSVERRTNEIGIRMALGADRLSVLRMVLRGAFAQVLLGLAIGVPAALVVSHMIASQLYGVAPFSPLVLLMAAGTLAAAAFIAALIPARQASQTEPMTALRAQ